MTAERGALDASGSSIPNKSVTSHFNGGDVTCFQGKTEHYRVETYNSSKMDKSGKMIFTEEPEYSDLVNLATEIYLTTYPNRVRTRSIERMKKSLSYPRTIVELIFHKEEPIGLGIFPKINTSEGPVLYSSRALVEGHDGQGLGTHILERGIQLHQEESSQAHRPLHWGTLMTQNELSIYTLRKLQTAGVVGKIFPFDYLYDDEEEKKDKDADAARHIMLYMHNLFHIDSMGIDNLTGVSRGELRELGVNETYRRAPEDSELLKIWNRMIKSPGWENGKYVRNLYMHLADGDVVYTTFELKKSGNGGSKDEILSESLDEEAA